jgi:hypothetical protein
MNLVFQVVGPLFYIPNRECRQRHLFLATSASYLTSTSESADAEVPLTGGVSVARGTGGKNGSGVCSATRTEKASAPR